MPLIGKKEIFAIEWGTDHPIFLEWKRDDFPHTFADFRYWANSIPIGDYENSVLLDVVVSYTKNFLKNEHTRQQFDFTGYDVESVFHLLHDAVFSGSFDDKHEKFFQMCRKKIIEEYAEMLPPHKDAKKYLKSRYKKAKKYIELYSDNQSFENDFTLSGWIGHCFSLSDLGGASFWDSVDIYLVTDKQIPQERLIWKVKGGNQIHSATLPLGYFVNVAGRFVNFQLEKITP